ncbi:MAG: MFS transporter [Anaerolineaceae bacterium]|nr:MFS transporter [Anaerolineaceae bacterium]
MKLSITNPLHRFHPKVIGSLYYGFFWASMSLFAGYFAIDLSHRGITEPQIGIINATRAICVVLIAPMITRAAERRRKRVRVLGLLIASQALIFLFYIFPDQFILFLGIVILSAILSGPIQALADGVIVRMTAKHQVEMGRMRMWGSLAFAVVGPLSGLVWARTGYLWMYVGSTILYLLTSLVASALEEPDAAPQLDEESAAAPERPLLQMVFSDWVLLFFLLAAFARAAGEQLFFSFSSLYIDDLTGNAFLAGLITAGSALLEIPVMLNVQKLIRRLGLVPVIFIGFGFQALGLLIFTLSTLPGLMYVGALVRNMGFAFFFISAVQFIDSRATEQEACTYQSIMNAMSWGLAPLIFSPLGGVIYSRLGAASVFQVATIIGFSALVLMVPSALLLRREKQPGATTAH